MLYKDKETGLLIRDIDFDKKRDVKIFCEAIKIHFNQIKKCGLLNELQESPDLKLLPYALGFAMRTSRINNSFFFLIFEGSIVGMGGYCENVKYSKGEKWLGCTELREPWTDKIIDMYLASARMLKKKGQKRILASFIKGHPMEDKLPKKRKIMRVPCYQIWELDV